MEKNIEIRNLNEFVVENAASELQTSHIDNLIYVFEFFSEIFLNKEITTDKILIDTFGKKMNENKKGILGFLRESNLDINGLNIPFENNAINFEKRRSKLGRSRRYSYS